MGGGHRNIYRMQGVPIETRGLKFITVKCNGHSPTDTGVQCPFGCSGQVTAVAVGKRQRLYSGVRMLTWFYLVSINISGWFKGVET
jgi:hypothetical protein